MKLSDLDYDLPAHLIAQHPAAERDGARLLTVSRGAAVVGHHVFRDLPELLRPGDLLVLNDTRVLPARLVGKRARTDGRWEGLFVRATAEGAWELLCQTRGRPTMGEIILVDGEQTSDQLRLRLIGRRGTHWLAEPQSQETAADLLARFGRVPLPPYIRKGKAEPVDRERYQTLYADRLGAVAAPTAGLHFTRQLLETLAQRGIGQAFVTLHIGPGTFQPVQTDD
ncbi:MAG: S-adenosylmethionine:tRNA ribosyltransferase-isomerase, partial [Candidatus Acidiferrum sp.]